MDNYFTKTRREQQYDKSRGQYKITNFEYAMLFWLFGMGITYVLQIFII